MAPSSTRRLPQLSLRLTRWWMLCIVLFRMYTPQLSPTVSAEDRLAIVSGAYQAAKGLSDPRIQTDAYLRIALLQARSGDTRGGRLTFRISRLTLTELRSDMEESSALISIARAEMHSGFLSDAERTLQTAMDIVVGTKQHRSDAITDYWTRNTIAMYIAEAMGELAARYWREGDALAASRLTIWAITSTRPLDPSDWRLNLTAPVTQDDALSQIASSLYEAGDVRDAAVVVEAMGLGTRTAVSVSELAVRQLLSGDLQASVHSLIRAV